MALHHRAAPDRANRAEAAASEIRAAGGRAIAVAADLGSTDEIGIMVERVVAELGPRTVLVTATSAYKTEKIGEIADDS